ncbi:MAG: heme-binding protein [Betaproteobacteria bacterium]|nr:heme-binding protein [Betaproteobacteria bacterium]
MTSTKIILNLDDAKKIAANAEAEAKHNNWSVVVAILDDGGHILLLQRMDNVQYGSVNVAIEKARAAIAFRRPTKVLESNITEGRLHYLGLPGALPVEGGLPIVVDGQFVGAVGVSGVRSNQDAQIAQAGINALGVG